MLDSRGGALEGRYACPGIHFHLHWCPVPSCTHLHHGLDPWRCAPLHLHLPHRLSFLAAGQEEHPCRGLLCPLSSAVGFQVALLLALVAGLLFRRAGFVPRLCGPPQLTQDEVEPDAGVLALLAAPPR